jgi:hypothetical protein
MNPKLWNLLHDGSLEKINGSVPGDLSLNISISYLRNRFSGEGAGFTIVLLKCTEFSFQPYDQQPLTDLASIAVRSPEILSAVVSDPLSICCVEGTLFLRYESARIQLDTGDDVSLDALESASTAYWTEWSERNLKTS